MGSELIKINPFLDPFSPPKGGEIAEPNQPLIKLDIPDIKTVIHKTTESLGQLSMVSITKAFTDAGQIPQKQVLGTDQNIGIKLDISMLSVGTKTLVQSNPSEIQTGTIRGRIPCTPAEVKQNLHLVSTKRTSSTSKNYSITELKQIAKCLQLPASGNKDVLANNIRNYIQELYGLD